MSVQARAWLAAFAILWLALPAGAAVPHQAAVPAYAEEQTILQHEKDTPEPGLFDLASGRNHFDRHFLVPFGRDSEQDLILQRGGNTWRTLRNGPIATISGTVLLLASLLALAMWRFVGSLSREAPHTGRRLLRFDGWQRLIHWTTAISFVLLAFTGLVILYGKQLLIPLVGHAAFSWLAIVSKYVHNFVGPFFILCSVLLFLTFVRRNLFRRTDWRWLRTFGGVRSGEHVPAGYFNAGEKVWFWGGVVLLGLVMSATGLILDFVNFKPTRYLIQLASYLHLAGATLYMAAAIGHTYLGTVGTPGAYEAMRRGTVDEGWAKEHHSLWYEELQARRPPVALPPAQPGATRGQAP